MKYKYVDANILGYKNDKCLTFYRNDDNTIDQDVFKNVSLNKETKSSVLCGYFEKRQGEGSAMMFVNISDPLCREKTSVPAYFTVADENAVVTEYTASGSRVLIPDADGMYKVSCPNAEYVFVTVE
jgi:hypothetical protein